MSSVIGAVGFTLAVYSFIRNNTQTLMEDRIKWRQYEKMLGPLFEEIQQLQDRLERWSEFWGITRDTPSTMLHEYWGTDGTAVIQILLDLTKDSSSQLEDEFLRYTGLNAGALRNDTAQGLTSIPQQIAELSNQSRGWNNQIWYKIRAVVYGNKIFEDNLKSANKNIELLEERSESIFRKKHKIRGREDFEETKQHASMREAFCILAKSFEAAKHIQVLHQNFLQMSDTDIDIYLDHDTSPENRLEILFNSSFNGRIKHLFHMSDMANRKTTNVQLDFQAPESGLPQGSHSINRLDDILEFPVSQANPAIYLLRKDMETLYFGTCLRNDCESEYIQNLLARDEAHPMLNKDITQLLYEIVENFFVLLRTKWLSALCICGLRSCITSPLRRRYTARLTKIEHLGSSCATNPTSQMLGCTAISLGQNFERLQILLTEIAKSSSIGKGQFQESFVTEGDEFIHDFLIRHIRKHFSEDLANVIWECHQYKRELEHIAPQNPSMKEVFDKLVWPLWLHYDDEVARPSRKRRTKG